MICLILDFNDLSNGLKYFCEYSTDMKMILDFFNNKTIFAVTNIYNCIKNII